MIYALYALAAFLAFSGAVFWLGTAYQAFAQRRDARIERERKEREKVTKFWKEQAEQFLKGSTDLPY